MSDDMDGAKIEFFSVIFRGKNGFDEMKGCDQRELDEGKVQIQLQNREDRGSRGLWKLVEKKGSEALSRAEEQRSKFQGFEQHSTP